MNILAGNAAYAKLGQKEDLWCSLVSLAGGKKLALQASVLLFLASTFEE